MSIIFPQALFSNSNTPFKHKKLVTNQILLQNVDTTKVSTNLQMCSFVTISFFRGELAAAADKSNLFVAADKLVFYLTSAGILLLYFQLGIRYCMAMASSLS